MRKIIENELLNELEFEYIRSSGPGGQKVNKTASKVQLRWNINNSQVFTEEEKKRIRAYLHVHRSSLIAKEDDVILESQDTRYQSQNKKIVIRRFIVIIDQALKKEKKRVEKKKGKSTLQREREWRKRDSEKKKSRRKIKDY